MGLLKNCLLCSLKTGCLFVAFYTFALAGLLLVFNVRDLVYAPEYLQWSRIISFIFSVFLFFAAICLLIGLFRKSVQLLFVWILIFVVYILYQIAFVLWNLAWYTHRNDIDPYWRMPSDQDPNIENSMLINIILFGVLIFGDILALVAVYSYREHLGGKGLIAVPVMA
ncbi:hypothetical protein BV898_08556 [Hypsibius exemplaris]|uniref:Uncharacterized protein n=1 Tax=Hypsibius exemplaris TaxID=2072580 RepID=A0A1W0WQ26_HYPEX|nr:hypothetical protein BV898_08556 [Hypsibius exemplaris]